MAVAVARRKVALGDFVGKSLEDPVVLELAQRVSYQLDPNYNHVLGMRPGKVEIKTKDGRTYSLKQDIPYGNPKRPMSWENLITKFRDCATYAAKPLPQESVNEAIQMLTNLEGVDDVSQIPRLLS